MVTLWEPNVVPGKAPTIMPLSVSGVGASAPVSPLHQHRRRMTTGRKAQLT